jgi:hypothetical protein
LPSLGVVRWPLRFGNADFKVVIRRLLTVAAFVVQTIVGRVNVEHE